MSSDSKEGAETPPPSSDVEEEEEENPPSASPLDSDSQSFTQVSSLRSIPSDEFASTTGGRAVYGIAGLAGIAIVAIAVVLARRKRLEPSPNEQTNDEQVFEGDGKQELE